MNTYAVAVSAIKDEIVHIRAVIWSSGFNKERAARDCSLRTFVPERGYHSHKWSVVKLTAKMIAEQGVPKARKGG